METDPVNLERVEHEQLGWHHLQNFLHVIAASGSHGGKFASPDSATIGTSKILLINCGRRLSWNIVLPHEESGGGGFLPSWSDAAPSL